MAFTQVAGSKHAGCRLKAKDSRSSSVMIGLVFGEADLTGIFGCFD
jgi:hypothetical protein